VFGKETVTTTLTTTKPTRERIVEIDTRLAELAEQQYRLAQTMRWQADQIHEYAGDKKVAPERTEKYGRRPERQWQMTFAEAVATCEESADSWRQSAVAKYRVMAEEMSALRAEQTELHLVWYEHQWSRFFFVTNTNGHIHESMHCSTCYDTTDYQWLTHLSDRTEAEAVADWGKVLCSVCYPSAPTEWTDGLPLAKVAAREEAARCKAERDAKKLAKALLPDGSTTTLCGVPEMTDRGEYIRKEQITTLAQAKTWLREVSDGHARNSSYRLTDRAWTPDNEEFIVWAIAQKTGSTVEAVAADAKAKAEKKAEKGYW